MSAEVIFINGIGTSEERRSDYVKIITEAFVGRKVELFFNPTAVSEYYAKDVESQAGYIDALYKRFTALVSDDPAGDKKRGRITVLTHSHGTHLLNEVLKKMKAEDRDLFVVYTFGGVTMIPKDMASKVKNYIYKDDLIGVSGNVAYDPRGVLTSYCKIHELMQKTGLPLEKAIPQQVALDMHAKYDPFNNSDTGEAVKKYGALFFSGKEARLEESEVSELVAKYHEACTKYRIKLLSTPTEVVQEQKSPSLELESLTKAAVQATGGLLDKNDRECHMIYAFKSVLEKLGRKALR